MMMRFFCRFTHIFHIAKDDGYIFCEIPDLGAHFNGYNLITQNSAVVLTLKKKKKKKQSQNYNML